MPDAMALSIAVESSQQPSPRAPKLRIVCRETFGSIAYLKGSTGSAAIKLAAFDNAPTNARLVTKAIGLPPSTAPVRLVELVRSVP